MTAFAAILHADGESSFPTAVADALAAVTGRPATSRALGRCTMAVSPMHPQDPAAPVSTKSGAIVSGTMLFEGPHGLAERLNENAAATAAELTGAAYARWNRRCTDYLTGEYAFVVWDPREQALLCARDGLGIRLLYVAEGPRTIVVTNVLGAALAHPQITRTLDPEVLVAFLARGGAADALRTCYRDVSVLPPGHTLALDADRPSEARMWRHWHFPLPDGVRRPDDVILEEYRERLREAVRDRAGAGGTSIFLSGGLDSTTMAAAATEVAPPRTLHAFTTRYPRYVDDVELPFTRTAAEHLGLPLTVLDADRYAAWHVDPADPGFAAPLDEPMLADWRDALGSAAAHATVALYGEDGDALLRAPGWSGLRYGASIASIGMAAARYAISERRRPYVGLRWRERMGIVRPRGERLPDWLTAEAHAILERPSQRTILGRAPEHLEPHPARPEAQTILTSTTISRNFAATIAPETTRQSIELRFPIMDSRLIRLVISIPAIPWCQHKTLVRRAYRGRLPPAVLTRPKTPLMGFNEEYVAEWRRTTDPRPIATGSPMEGWIDTGRWMSALRAGAPGAAMAAWRVTALDAWLAAWARGSKDAACTR